MPSVLEALEQLDRLLEQQALALEGGRSDEVECLSIRIQQAMDILDRAELQAIRGELGRDPDWRGALQRLLASARLHHQALQAAQATIGTRRAALRRCGVHWYGDRPPARHSEASLDLRG